MNIKWVKVDKEWGNNKQLSHIMIMMIPWIMYTVKYLLKMNQGYSYLITNHNFIEFKPVTLHVSSGIPDSSVSHNYTYSFKRFILFE